MLLFFHFLCFNIPDNNCHKQKWHVFFLTCIRLVVRVLTCAHAITHMKWMRLQIGYVSNRKMERKCPNWLVKKLIEITLEPIKQTCKNFLELRKALKLLGLSLNKGNKTKVCGKKGKTFEEFCFELVGNFKKAL